jgi:hypothetical protein
MSPIIRMSKSPAKSPNNAALLAALRDAIRLCQSLDLPKETALFQGFVDRFKKEKPTFAILNDEFNRAWNLAKLSILARSKDWSQFKKVDLALLDVMSPGWREKLKRIDQQKKQRKLSDKKAVMQSGVFWQLDGESDLRAITIPAAPKVNAATTVRLTHSNSDYPFDEAEFFVRLGNPDNPTEQDDLDSAGDWVQARLVEELVFVDDKEILRSQANEPFKGLTPWWGTYDAELRIPRGRHSIEIKIVSHRLDVLSSGVVADWHIEVR